MISKGLASNARLLPALPALPACNPAWTRHLGGVPDGIPTIPQCRRRAGRKPFHNRPPSAGRDN